MNAGGVGAVVEYDYIEAGGGGRQPGLQPGGLGRVGSDAVRLGVVAVNDE